MEAIRWVCITALAPVAWGVNYAVTDALLPAEHPLHSSAIRALVPGLVLLVIVRRLPAGAWWWRSLVAGSLSIGGFFVCVYVAAQRVPSGVAASVMGLSPICMAVLAHFWSNERLRRPTVIAGLAALVGVLLVAQPERGADPLGLAAALGAMLSSAAGFVLVKRWAPAPPSLCLVAWQLTWSGLLLVPVALAVEGTPNAPTAGELVGLLYLCLPATLVAYWVWFSGLARLSATSVGIIGALNPISGLVVAAVVLGEHVSPSQAAGVLLIVAGMAVHSLSRRDRRISLGPGAHAARRGRPVLRTAPPARCRTTSAR